MEKLSSDELVNFWETVFSKIDKEIDLFLSANKSANDFIADPDKREKLFFYSSLYLLTLIHNDKIAEAKNYIKNIHRAYAQKEGIKIFKWMRTRSLFHDNSIIKAKKIADAILIIEFAQAFYDFIATFCGFLRKVPGLSNLIPIKWTIPKKYNYTYKSVQYIELSMFFIIFVPITLLILIITRF